MFPDERLRPQLHYTGLLAYRITFRIGLLFASDYFSHRIGVSFTLSRSDPVRHVGAKSLRSGGDTKNNPILCRAVNYRV